MRQFLLLTTFIFCTIFGWSQDQRFTPVTISSEITFEQIPQQQTVDLSNHVRCFTAESEAQRRTEGKAPSTEQFESWIAKKIEERKNSGVTERATYNIPYIVHVIHDGESIGSGDNISSTQIYAQIQQINDDFQRMNSDAGNTPAVFTGVAGSIDIEFVPAIIDDNGDTMTTPGINRINRNTEGWSAPPFGVCNPGNSFDNSYIENTIKPATQWDPTLYFNIWTMDVVCGILGYAQFPTGSGLDGLPASETSNTDGCVLLASSVGSIANPGNGAPFNLGRTATHEIGHWLGLRHIWGDGTCATDYCDDTPTQSGPNSSNCPTFPSVTCSNGPNGDMFMNYMDYTTDACMNIFTVDQVARFEAVLDNSPRRVELLSSNVGGTAQSGVCFEGTLVNSDSVAVCPGLTATTTTNGDESIPVGGSYNFQFLAGADGTGANSTGPGTGFSINIAPTTTYTFDAGVNGVLDFNGLPDMEGTWYVAGFVRDSLDVVCSGVTAEKPVTWLPLGTQGCVDPDPCEAGTLTNTDSVAVCPGDAAELSTNGDEVIPSAGGYGWYFTPSSDGTGGPFAGGAYFFGAASPTGNFFDSDLGGGLGGDVMEGTWIIQGFTYEDTADVFGSICELTNPGKKVNFLTSADANCLVTAPVNDTCGGALTLTIGAEGTCDGGAGFVSTSTASATETQLTACDQFGNSDLWYTFTATSEAISFNSLTGDPGIEVLDGTCGALGNSVGCANNESGVITGLTIGNDYTVIIWTDLQETTVEFCIEEFALPSAPANDDCANATSLVCNGAALTGQTTISAVAETSPDGCGNDYGVWYSFVGNGDEATITSNTSFDHSISVFSSDTDCNGAFTTVACEDGSTGTETTTFVSENGTQYYVYIAGWQTGSTTTGDFEIELTCITPPMAPVNDTCSGAIMVACGDTISGNTGDATLVDQPGTCVESMDEAPGIWYSLMGTGDTVILSMCGMADFDTKIGVFTGACGALVCFDGNDDGDNCIGSASEVKFASELGTEYSIYVTGWNGGTGNFDLAVSCIASPEPCEAGTLAESGPLTLCPGEEFTFATNGDESVPSGGTYFIEFFPGVDGTGGPNDPSGFTLPITPPFTNDDQILPGPPLRGTWYVTGSINDANGLCSELMDSLTLVFLDSLDMTCAPPEPCEAGTLASTEPISMCPGESASIIVNGAQIPSGGDHQLVYFQIPATTSPSTGGGSPFSISHGLGFGLTGTWYYTSVVFDSNFAICSVGLDTGVVIFLDSLDVACAPPAEDTCDAPTTLSIDNITASGAEFSWTGSGASFDVELVDITAQNSATQNPTETDVSNPHTFTGLAASNDYEAWVRANCSDVDLILTGVIDATLPGGKPKAVELYALNDIADLSVYGIGSANNGNGTNGEEFTFSGSATAGDFIYITASANEAEFMAWFGFAADFVDAAVNVNGNDAIELFKDGNVVDVFGDIDGPPTNWNYGDGWAYRVDNTGPDGDVFVLSNWNLSGFDALDGDTSNATAATPFPIGTYGTGPRIPSEWEGPIAFTTLAGSCPEPTGLASIPIATDEALIAWFAGGSETDWNVELVDVTNGGMFTGTPTSTVSGSPTETLIGLTPETVYAFSVQANCGADSSIWAIPDTFMTPALPPSADFSAAPTTVCLGDTVQFTDLSSGTITTWNWDFGNGVFGTAQNPSLPYTTSGTYTVTLIVSNADGSDTATIVDYITVEDPPVGFGATATATTINEGESTTLQMTGTFGGTYAWYEEGNLTPISTSPSFGISPTATTIYTATCTTPNGVCTVSATVTITVNPITSTPVNDTCGGAIAVTCGDTISGNTEDATLDDAPATCITSLDEAPGIWYSFTGTGDNVTLSMCSMADFDTKIGVFTGSCGALVCEAGNDDGAACPGSASEVDFTSVLGTEYYIYVTGWNGGTGNFDLAVSCETPVVCPAFVGDSIPNPIIVGALPYSDIQNQAECFTDQYAQAFGSSDVVYTVTTGANADSLLIDLCNDTTDFDTWMYIVAGDGVTQLDNNNDSPAGGTCSFIGLDVEPNTTYYIVVEGNAVTDNGWFEITIEEIALPDCPAPTDLAAAVTGATTADLSWTAVGSATAYDVEIVDLTATGTFTGIPTANDVAGTTYMATGLTEGNTYEFYVRSNCGADSSTWSGPFEWDQNVGPVNDLCAGAIEVACGDTISGNTEAATLDDAPATCITALDEAPGIWYSFTGTGDNVTLSMCSMADFDTKIGVFTGSCGALVCEAGNDDGGACPGSASEVQFNSILGTEYLIYVTGWSGGTGNFDLAVSCGAIVEAPENDTCGGALALTIGANGTCDGGAGFVSTSTVGATETMLTTCDQFGNFDLWYTFTATSEAIAFNSITGDPGIEVLDGNCAAVGNSLGCLNNETGIIEGLTIGNDYYAIIWTDLEEATVEFCIEEFVVVATCEAGTLDPSIVDSFLVCPDSVVTFFTSGDDTIPTGGGYGVYFIPGADGTGGIEDSLLIFDVTLPYDFDADLNGLLSFNGLPEFSGTWYVFGVTYTDDTDLPASICDWTSDYMVVNFLEAGEGPCAPPPAAPENDSCAGAFAAVLSPSHSACMATAGTTVGATQSEPQPSCSFTWYDDDVWYTFMTNDTIPSSGIVVHAEFADFTGAGIAVYESCDAATELVCSAFNNELDSLIVDPVDLSPNTMYWVRVWTPIVGEFGTFDLCIYEDNTPPPPPLTCIDTLYDNGGIDGDYAADSDDATTICPDNAGDLVTIEFTFVDIESSTGGGNQDGCWDFLTIYDGADASAPVLATTLCGEESGDGGVPSVATSLLSVGDMFTSSDASGCLTVVFISDGTVQEGGYVATITCNPPPTCAAPTALNVGNITETSADLSWTPGGDETSWDIEIVDITNGGSFTGNPTASGLTDTFYLATGLNPDNEYEFYVLADCEFAESDWTGPEEFETEAPIPANDSCAGAIVIGCDDIINGSTATATADGSVPTCVTTLGASPGVWYLFQGNGDNVTFSLCGSDFDTKIGVFTGTCDALVCETGEDDDNANCGGNDPEVSVSTSPGTDYYVYVTGFNGDAGDFTLNVTCITPPINDVCAGAIEVGCDDLVYGSTVGASNEDDLDFCGTSLTAGPGVWYSFTGTGDDVTFSLCDDTTDYDSKIGVFEGSCAGLTCVDGNDDECGTASEIEVSTTVGTNYYIYVTGFLANTGNFGLSVTCVEPSCDTADIALDLITDVVCGNDGAIDVTVSGGSGSFDFLWSNGETTEDIAGLAAGDYTLEVTDTDDGCPATATFTVGGNDALEETSAAVIIGLPCDGSAGTASIDVTIGGGLPPYDFSWDNGAITEDLSGLAAGSYTLTVTDANSCVYTSQTFVIEPSGTSSLFEVEPAVVTNVDCFGNATGAIDISVSGGTAPYTYRWSNDLHTEDIENLEAGEYVFFVIDATGCEYTSAIIVVEEPSPIEESAAAVVVDASCNGGADGSIDISITGGVAPYTYLWSNGSTEEDPADFEAGTHQAVVTDANGCEFLSEVYVVGEPSEVAQANASITDADCNGAATGSIDINVSGGTPGYSFVWSNGTFNEDLAGAPAGDYNVVITDANGCSIVSETFTIGEPTAIEVSGLTVTDADCNGASTGAIDISVIGGTPPYTYVWSNGDMTQDISDLAAGDYTGVITDANGCTLVSPIITVGEPTAVGVSAVSITDVDCNGASTGAIDITPDGGTSPYTFLWSNGATTEDLSDLTTGDYTTVITDANGCTFTSPVLTIAEPDVLVISSVDVTDLLCNGDADGAIDIEVSGGTAPYTYLWSNSEITEDLIDLSAGDYLVAITDGNGCQTSATVTVGEPAAIFESLPPVVTQISCNGEVDGAIDIDIQGGTLPYNVVWSNGETTEDISGLAAGDYSYVLTDANGCIFDPGTTITIVEPAVLSESAEVTNAACFGAASGGIDITVVGGTTPYSYFWSNGSSSEDLSGLSAGDYSVDIIDANGCELGSATYTVTEPATELTATVDVTDETSNGAGDGTATVSVSGGDGPYTLEWAGGFGTDETIDDLTSGIYCVDVTDSNGCTITVCGTVGNPTSVFDFLEISDIELYPNPTSQIANLKISFTKAVDVELAIIDVLGKVYNSETLLNTKTVDKVLDMTAYAGGTYFIRISVEGQIITKSLVVQH